MTPQSRKISYGAGFLAASGCTFLAWHFARMDMHVLLLATFLMQPFLLIAVSILASDLLHNQRIRLYSAEMQIRQNKEQLQQLSQQFEKVLESKKELQQLVIEQEAPIASVCNQITLLWQLNNEERYSAIVDLIVQATGAKSSELYLEQGHQFFLQTSRSTQNISYPARLNEDDLLVKKVLQHGQVFTIREIIHTEQEPSADVHWYKLAQIRHELGEDQAALQDVLKALRLTPGLHSAYQLACDLAFYQHDWSTLHHLAQSNPPQQDEAGGQEALQWLTSEPTTQVLQEVHHG